MQPETLSQRLQAAFWIGIGLLMIWCIALLGPVLTPFLLAGIFAYICNPIVDRLERWRLPRVIAVTLVLVLLAAILAALVLILVPLVVEETTILAERLPDWLVMVGAELSPWLQKNFGVRLDFNPAQLKALVTENWSSLQVVGNKVFHSLKIGGAALTGLLVNLTLVPVVVFYLLVDWHRLLARIDTTVPRPWHDRVSTLAGEVDAVLSGFLRGQVLVMLALALFYSIALAIAGLPSAVAIGILTGLLTFIPYVGFATGFLLALLVASLQFAGLGPIIGVLVVFGLGQLLEGFVLTPYLVGNRIGLHPLAVIFALMAFGQLFGFFGILLALPASAALLVGLRALRARYLTSDFYRGEAGGDDA